MKTKNRIISILLVAIMMLSMMPFTVFANESEITEVSTFSELLEAVNSDKEYIKLTKDIEDVVPDDELPTKHRLVFDGGKNYLLDLNGYTLKVINHANEYYTDNVPMISVSGNSKLEIQNGGLVFDNWYAGSNRKARGVVHVADTSTLLATKVNMQNKYAGNVVSATADAHVTLDGGEYTVQSGFAIYLDRQASLTLDGDVSIRTVVGDSANTQYVDGYGALYSESSGELIVNYAFFKSGIQVSKSQIGAFSTANHEVTINGKVLTEDIFVGTSTEAKNQNKEYFWYSYTQNALERTSDNSFSNVVRVISYDKKYPIDVQSGIAMINGNPVTEASYGQTVTLVAHTPEEGMEFVRWDTSGVELANYYNATTTFTMLPAPVYFAAYYGKESVKSVSLTVDAPVIGQKISEATITVEGATLELVEWYENIILVDENDIFKPGKTYTIKALLYPPDEHKFADGLTATVNGNSAAVDANTQYAYVEYEDNIVNILGLAEKRVDKGGMFYSKVNSRYEFDNVDYLFRKLEKTIGIKIVLSHYPENYEYVGEYSYSKYNFDIMFSGHAHGGQFILPGIGGIFAPGQGLLPKYYKGIYGDKSKLVVSRGLGNSGFPLRLFNRPDLVVLDVIKE